MKSFKTFLTEAPMAEYDDSAVGNRRTKSGRQILKKNEKPLSSFTEKDRKLIKSERTKGKLEKVLKAFKQDFRIFFADFAGSNKWSERGFIDDKELRGESKMNDYLERVGLLSPTGGLTEKAKKSINVVYVNNVGDQKIGMTPWIIMHRLGHGLNRGGTKSAFYNNFVESIRYEIYEFLNDNYMPDEDRYKTDRGYDQALEEWKARLRTLRTKNVNDGQDIIHWFFRTFGNFNSARQTEKFEQGEGKRTKGTVKYERFYEFLYDAFVAFVWYAPGTRDVWEEEPPGKLPFKFETEKLPEKLVYKGPGMGNIALAISDEFVMEQAVSYYKKMISNTERSIVKMFDEAEGQIIAM